METVRWERQYAGKCAGTHGNHHEQADAKSTYGCGQNKCADAECGTDLPAALTLLSVKLWQHGGHD